MLYSFYRTGSFITRFLPRRFCYSIAEMLATVYYSFSDMGKKELRENLRIVLGEGTASSVIEWHARRVYKNFAKYLVDFFKFPNEKDHYLSKLIDCRGLENLDEALKSGKGAITLSLHLGNWELGAAVVGSNGYPVTALALEHKDKRINDFFFNQRLRSSFKAVPIGLGMRECFRAMKRNEVLAIMGDKDYTSTGVNVGFFGSEAIMPKGPALFSLKTGAPIVFSVMVREKNDRFTLILEKPIIYEAKGDTQSDMKNLMRMYLSSFEKYIKAYPDQWYAFNRIWNQDLITR